MADAWESLQSVASTAIDTLWFDFAKQGRESEVFSPMASYPGASAWLAESMSLSTNYTTRKLGAMLAGWIIDSRYLNLLPAMLDRERKVFAKDKSSANSVGEDIMFAATRWAWCDNPEVRDAGTSVLAGMTWDALNGTPWNTANWAAANLHRATGGKHPIFATLMQATDEQMQGQRFLQNVVKALKQNDEKKLSGFVTPPPETRVLPPDDRQYSVVKSLWSAAAVAQKALL